METRNTIQTKVKEYVADILEDEVYNLEEVFTKAEIADAAASLVDRLIVSKYSEKYPTLAFDDSRKVAIVKLGYTWTALSSTTGSFVSVSNYDGTGVSRSEARIFHDAYNITKDEVKDLLDMMDEARFHMIMTQNV